MLNQFLVRAQNTTQRKKIGKYLQILQDQLLYSKGYYLVSQLYKGFLNTLSYIDARLLPGPFHNHTVPKHFKINPNPAELMQDECFNNCMSRIQLRNATIACIEHRWGYERQEDSEGVKTLICMDVVDLLKSSSSYRNTKFSKILLAAHSICNK